jgi:hypothetical protein
MPRTVIKVLRKGFMIIDNIKKVKINPKVLFKHKSYDLYLLPNTNLLTDVKQNIRENIIKVKMGC